MNLDHRIEVCTVTVGGQDLTEAERRLVAVALRSGGNVAPLLGALLLSGVVALGTAQVSRVPSFSTTLPPRIEVIAVRNVNKDQDRISEVSPVPRFVGE